MSKWDGTETAAAIRATRQAMPITIPNPRQSLHAAGRDPAYVPSNAHHYLCLSGLLIRFISSNQRFLSTRSAFNSWLALAFPS